MSEQLSLFDYQALDSETRIVVQQKTDEIKSLMRRSAQDIIDIGQKLIEVKARLGHGNFGNWLEAEFGWTPQLARQFMNVAEQFSQVEKETLFRFGSSALRLLASPSTPESAREEAIKRAERGEAITHSEAKALVEEHKSQPAPVSTETLNLSTPLTADTPDTDTDLSEDFPDKKEEMEHPAYKESITYTRSVQAEKEEIEHPPAPPKYDMGAMGSSKSKEHYTPASILVLVKKVLGVIDLDPCANPEKSVPASTHFTKEDDGLVRDWNGSVFMNPPFGDAIADWVTKLNREYQAGRVTEAIALVPARTDTNWFQVFGTRTLCFWKGRIIFVGNETAAPFPTAFAYLGSDDSAFVEIFKDYGLVYRPINPF